jgi:GYF domain 2
MRKAQNRSLDIVKKCPSIEGMTVAYHLWQDEAIRGPFTFGQMRAMWNAGQITSQNMFSTNGGKDWQTLAEISAQLDQVSVPTQNNEAVEALKKLESYAADTRRNRAMMIGVVCFVCLLLALLVFIYTPQSK